MLSMMIFSVIFLVSLAAVASNPSPYFAALGLMMGAGAGCGMLMQCGMAFLSLILFLVYLGGMLVVFAYSVALTVEPYPYAWGSWEVFSYVLGYMFLVIVMWVMFVEDFGLFGDVEGYYEVVRLYIGVAEMYNVGGYMLLVVGWTLMMALLVVLELTRGHFRGCLRAV
uniref:NADH-ubiquinone oxidoreductase chain 6 n=1 Tax=Polypterus teugelsi TaxID=764557 RepID=F2W4T2_9ACTI|nr:NADH dehydrogenase subunit 6 [Polypterus teugelsi]ADG95320.1 NADH dehydrogenase subunit 6 [Polypterus teugelsi]